jgi:Domain of unknown function (DUF4389)
VAEVSLGAGVSPPAAPVLRTGDEILTAFAGPGRQRRVTVLFRLLLVIPHYIVLYALGIAVGIVAVICWFAALFTGRLPAGLADFLVGWLRWSTRVFAYVGLLTDQYPPFTLADADYPVRVSAAPGRLNRLAVLFRIILAFPVAMLVGILWSGVLLAGLVIWLIVLITGTMPGPAYQAVAAVVRFGARFYGYFYLMSGTYPGGLFGDPADADADAVAAGAGAVAGSPGAEPAQPDAARPAAPQLDAAQPPAAQPEEAVQPGYGQPGYGQPGYAAPGAAHREATATASWPADPRAWRLVLSSGARQLVGLFIVLGSVVLVGYITVGVVAASHAATGATRVNAINSVSAAHAKLSRQLSGLSQQITACQSQSAVLSCVTKLDEQAAQDFAAFASAVRSTPVPSSAAAAADRLAAVTGQVQSAFQQLGAATSAAEYRKIDSNTVVPAVDQFNSAYQSLGVALGAT